MFTKADGWTEQNEKEYDMRVNIKKTKVMKVSRKGEGVINITIDGEILEQVEQFRYLVYYCLLVG